MCFYTVFQPENDPRGSKHVALTNTKNSAVFTVLVYIFNFPKFGLALILGK